MHSFPSHNNLSIEKRIHSGFKPQFAICKICRWSATVLKLGTKNNKNNKGGQDVVHICPSCSSSDLSLITIANDIHN
jgi:hypothetical protein